MSDRTGFGPDFGLPDSPLRVKVGGSGDLGRIWELHECVLDLRISLAHEESMGYLLMNHCSSLSLRGHHDEPGRDRG